MDDYPRSLLWKKKGVQWDTILDSGGNVLSVIESEYSLG